MAEWPLRGILSLLSGRESALDVDGILGRRAGRPAAAVALEKRPQVELTISKVLRYGVVVSSMLVAAGVVALLLSGQNGTDGQSVASQLISGAGSFSAPQSPGDILLALSRGEPSGMVSLGLLVLTATPVLSVSLSAVYYVLERDRPFVFITLLVLLILAGSAAIGVAK